MRCSDLRMGLAAVTVFLPVVLTAAYGVTRGDNPAEEAAAVAVPTLRPFVALEEPPVALKAATPVAPLTLTAASEVATATPAVAATEAASPLREAHAKRHHWAKERHPHHAG